MQPVVSMKQAWNHNTLWRDDREHKIRSFFLKVSGAQAQRQVATESHSWCPLRVSGSWKALIWYLYQPKGTYWYLEQRPSLHTRLSSPSQLVCSKLKMNCSLVFLCCTKKILIHPKVTLEPLRNCSCSKSLHVHVIKATKFKLMTLILAIQT